MTRRNHLTHFALVTTSLVALSCAVEEPTAGDEWWSAAGADAFNSELPSMHVSRGDVHVLIEVARDDLIHVEMTRADASYQPESIYLSPMIAHRSFDGPRAFTEIAVDDQEGGFETADMRVTVDAQSMCLTVYDLDQRSYLSTICPSHLGEAWQGLSIDPHEMRNAYGLGNYFYDPSSSDGDWDGRLWDPEYDGFGNFRRSFHGAAPSTSQFPVLYALGDSLRNYALFLDHPYKIMWDLRGDWWQVGTTGQQIRFFVMTGPNFQDLHRDFIDLVGHPAVPPRHMFGFFMSRFGYESWQQIDEELASLREDGFPIDGFSLDTQWFGNTFGADPATSTMGTLRFDPDGFPNAESRVRQLAADGISLMTIEESLVADSVDSYQDMRGRGYLVRHGCATCDASYLNQNNWWGRGGYIDWTNPDAGDYWHDTRRQPLIDMGITAHWTDLGEPESSLFDREGYYFGLPGIDRHSHADIHNLYGFLWEESIARGYARNGVRARPFMMARGGAPGMQRFGAAMWSGDIARNMGSLRAQLNTQMHLSLCGIEYYGSDAGGFTSHNVPREANFDDAELYTQWFANSAMIDVPLRPHGWAIGADRQSFAPNVKGHGPSNLENLLLRYRLSPYVYSLAHLAFRYGDPVFPPVVFYYQDDPNVREMGNVKMIGPDLLFAVVANFGETERRVYLPAGRWVSFHTNEWFVSRGGETAEIPVYRDGLFTLPLFARAGAIIPMMHVDDGTMNISGMRSDGSDVDDLIARVYASSERTSFTLFEDDGVTIGYREGRVMTTEISQQVRGTTALVVFEASSGSYDGMPQRRAYQVELVTDGQVAARVSVNGAALSRCENLEELRSSRGCFVDAGRNLVVARSDVTPLGRRMEFELELTPTEPVTSVHFVCDNGQTTMGDSIYIVGNVPELGQWDAARAIPLIATRYPRWTGVVDGLPPETRIEWKCLRRADADPGRYTLEPGAPNVVVTAQVGYSGTTRGGF